MGHPSYTPDLAPKGLRLFPKMKPALKGRIFQDIENIQEM
jgi:hypothetical protein